MTWNLTPYGNTRLPLPGVSWRDLSDEEFAAAEALHPGIRDRGYFERVDESSRFTRARPEPPTEQPAEVAAEEE